MASKQGQAMLQGIVEADESYIGGKPMNRYPWTSQNLHEAGELLSSLSSVLFNAKVKSLLKLRMI